ncbi:transposase domain-containing protein [Actinoplanes oblitus]|uniref:transposase domain-containing protein n=1 Tax=Actinoplanes oblitus TaxID=3040509 RepID=UPI0038996913
MRSVTVAAGVFAPGHAGELTRFLPFELVDDVLAGTGRVQRRVRVLPSRVVVYFVIALGMFPHLGYALVWAKMVSGLKQLSLPSPSESALRQARRRSVRRRYGRCSRSWPVLWPGRTRRGCRIEGCGRWHSTAAARSRVRTIRGSGAGSARSITGWAGPGIPS